MPIITINLDDDTVALVAERATAAGLSNSEWIAQTLEQYIAKNKWPDAWLDLAGSFPDFPLREEFENGQGADTPRISG